MQTRFQSAVEAVANTAIGMLVALLTQAVVFPLFNIAANPLDHLAIASIFTVVSIVRGYAVRRLFNSFRSNAK